MDTAELHYNWSFRIDKGVLRATNIFIESYLPIGG
jgi:hypothetical protein